MCLINFRLEYFISLNISKSKLYHKVLKKEANQQIFAIGCRVVRTKSTHHFAATHKNVIWRKKLKGFTNLNNSTRLSYSDE